MWLLQLYSEGYNTPVTENVVLVCVMLDWTYMQMLSHFVYFYPSVVQTLHEGQYTLFL